MDTPTKIFKKIFEEAKVDPNIIGFFLCGSRGKGFQTKYSDYDTYIIVKDKVVKNYKERYPFRKYEGVDLVVFSYTEFKNCAPWGSPEAFSRYSFSHVKALIDKNGKIQDILDELAKVPEKFLSKHIPGALDDISIFSIVL